MEDKLYKILTSLRQDEIDTFEAIDEVMSLHNSELKLFQKNRLDLLNWAKSELKQDLSPKMDKTMNPYRSEKLIFLRKLIKWIEN